MTNRKKPTYAKPVSINLRIPLDRIAELFASAIDGGDPVTTAARGGWCDSIRPGGISKARAHSISQDYWYGQPQFYDGGFLLYITEVTEETTGAKKTHRVSASIRALAARAQGGAA